MAHASAFSTDAPPRHAMFWLVCFGHFVNDTYSSFIYPLLPEMTERLHLTPGQAFWLIPLFACMSSFLQPLYGLISDRYLRRGFAVFGPVIAGVFLSAIGHAESYLTLMLILIAGGIGVGIFHPQGAAIAAQASGGRRRIGMAIFSATGTLGVALGPFLVTRAPKWGLTELSYLAIGCIVTGAILFVALPPLERPSIAQRRAQAEAGGFVRALQIASGPLVLLYVVTVLRASTQMMVNAYYPFFLKANGAPTEMIGNALTIFLFAVGIGGLAGGLLAERINGRTITIYSGLAAGPLLMAAFCFPGSTGFLFLAAGGFALGATIPVNVAMAQELVPQQTATVSALMMGFAWGLGSLAPRLAEPLSPYVGGYRGVMILGAAITLASTLPAFFLPRERAHSRRTVPVEDTSLPQPA